ncbi:hypothetical protein [Hymenobacter crusticola]|uniref:Uncharacterized protein n=1 Tax=Hymenobacter crusticola TaxID=1770526 RepID=A0A243WFX7_9BACT|nr:hypothetical protein [Hymenobacter crusticola]OUJ74676.1 hypothetical protein BXP70_07885 [Hymenobacter crusticola]
MFSAASFLLVVRRLLLVGVRLAFLQVVSLNWQSEPVLTCSPYAAKLQRQLTFVTWVFWGLTAIFALIITFLPAT